MFHISNSLHSPLETSKLWHGIGIVNGNEGYENGGKCE